MDCEWSIFDRHGGSKWDIGIRTDGDGNVESKSGVACPTATPDLVLPQSADVVHTVSEQHITHITTEIHSIRIKTKLPGTFMEALKI